MDVKLNNLIGPDIRMMRDRYDEALELQGVPATYQYPLFPDSDVDGEPVVDSYSEFVNTNIFFDGNPKIKTLKRYGWVVENDNNLPFLIHCSFHLPHVQKDSLFRISGQYSEMPDRVFRVTEITMDIQAPDHIVCAVVPVYDEKHVVGRTETEIKKQYNKSNYFLKPQVDYRGDPHKTKEETTSYPQ